MAFITQTRDNLAAERIGEGLRFTKLDQRGKVFIEYLSAEKAWVPLTRERIF